MLPGERQRTYCAVGRSRRLRGDCRIVSGERQRVGATQAPPELVLVGRSEALDVRLLPLWLICSAGLTASAARDCLWSGRPPAQPKYARTMKGDRVEIVVAADDGSRTYEIVATRAGRRVEITTGSGVVEVVEVTRTGEPVRTARFMASRVVAPGERGARWARPRPRHVIARRQ